MGYKKLELAVGSTFPYYGGILLDADGVPVDITNAIVTFKMRLKDKSAPALIDTTVGVNTIDGSKGKVRYEWTTGDTALGNAGLYGVQFKAVQQGGEIFFAPAKWGDALVAIVPGATDN